MFKNLNKKKNRFSRQFGLTLVEFMVVMAVISLIVVSVLVNYRAGQKQYILSQAAQQLASDLRKAQNMAMSGVEISGICDTSNPCDGYGVYIKAGDVFYLIYAGKGGNKSYQSGVDEIIENVYLPQNVKIQNISPVFVLGLDIFFEPPAPTTYINDLAGDPPATSGEIILELEGISLTKKVSVTSVGLVVVGDVVPPCTPNCAGKECGPDGCGGQCPPGCSGEDVCYEDICCTPNCAGKECGPDGCGGECPPGCSGEDVCYEGGCIGPIMYLPLDGDTLDYSGNNNHGVAYGAVYTLDGRIDGAYEFDGVDDYIHCGQDSSLNIRDEITLTAWFKPFSLGEGNYNCLVAKENYQAYQLKTDSPRRAYTSMWINGFRRDLMGATIFSLNEWHHFAATFDGSTIRVYLDGQPDGSFSVSGTISDSAFYDLIVGGAYESGNYNAHGIIDDVRIYNIALTPEQINDLYESAPCHTCELFGYACGIYDDICGGTIDCGECIEGYGCDEGVCKECSLIFDSSTCLSIGCSWSGESGQVFYDEFLNHDNWIDPTGDWDQFGCSPAGCAHGDYFNPSDFELSAGQDLSGASSANITFDVRERGGLEPTDCLNYALYDGLSWSADINIFCDDMRSKDYISQEIVIPEEYFVNDFRFRFKGQGFGLFEDLFIDNFEITKTSAGVCY